MIVVYCDYATETILLQFTIPLLVLTQKQKE